MHADYISTGAKIVSISNTDGNAERFEIQVSGGTGPCASSILFQKSTAGDPEVFKRAYVAAMMAMAMGLRVDVYNYSGSSCTQATFIRAYQ